MVGMGATAYALSRTMPLAIPAANYGLAAATRLARQRAPGQVLTAGPSMLAGRPAWVFRIREAHQLVEVSVVAATGSVQVVPLPQAAPPGQVSRQAAGRAALHAVPGSRLVSLHRATAGAIPIYAATVADAAGHLWQVTVSGTSGKVLAITRESAPTGGQITASRADQLAVRAVGGGQVLKTRRSEPSDQGVWHYQVTVLLPTSTRMVVMVSPEGQVLSVAPASGS